MKLVKVRPLFFGQGAPLAPIYHHALARYVEAVMPVVSLNLGGVGNVTWVDPGKGPEEMLAFDTGPANAPLNDLVGTRLGLGFDEGGALAAQGAVDAAIELYREVLERDPSNESALEALERLIQSEEHQRLIAGILEPIYRDSSQYEKLIQVHEIQAAHADSADMKVELLHQIAELYEVALEDYGNAFHSFARALGEDPADLNTQEQLERIARATGAFEQLAQVYEQRVEGLEDVSLATQLHVKAATIREEQLGDAETAIAHYQQVLSLDADHIEAATALERLFHMTERYPDLAAILLEKAKILDIPEDQKDHLFRAAAIHEEILEKPEDAIAVYKKVLEVDSEEVRALDKLIELHLRLEKWQPLLGFYERKADIVFDPDEKKSLYLEVGAVYEREIGDVDKAIDTYQRILEIDPDDLTAIQRLDALYQASGNWEELRAILERSADLAGDPNEVISYRYRIADLWDHKLGDSTRAVDGYREILALVPDHQPTLDALERMIQEGKEPNQAALVLEPIYRQYGESARLVAVLEVPAHAGRLEADDSLGHVDPRAGVVRLLGVHHPLAWRVRQAQDRLVVEPGRNRVACDRLGGHLSRRFRHAEKALEE